MGGGAAWGGAVWGWVSGWGSMGVEGGAAGQYGVRAWPAARGSIVPGLGLDHLLVRVRGLVTRRWIFDNWPFLEKFAESCYIRYGGRGSNIRRGAECSGSVSLKYINLHFVYSVNLPSISQCFPLSPDLLSSWIWR